VAEQPETAGTEAKSAEVDSAKAVEAKESELRRELDEARARADDHYRSWQRSAADFANFKRRVDDEKRFAERWLMQELLTVLDDFERAWATVPRELMRLSWLEGLLQINSKLLNVLQQHGLARIEAAGKDFSPLEHEAVMREEEVDAADQTSVVAELQPGYRLHDRVLRPTLVKVGKPKAVAPGGEAGASSTTETQDGIT